MRLENLWKKGKKALVSYMMVGYPDYETSMKAFRTLLREGTDILEIGFPFSDPVADGPTIQTAHELALREGISSKHVFELSQRLREEFQEKPFLLMTYYNPIFRMGLENFCRRAKDSGIDGFIVPDLPPEEGIELKGVCEKLGLSVVFLASPTSTEKRLKLICEKSDHMVYFVSLTGTTGAREELPIQRLRESLSLYRSVCKKPVVVGFGISKSEQAREIASFSDGIVVGSHFVKLAGNKDLEGLSRSVKAIKQAIEGLG
ncbi:tryptophan synthase subunit alpha [Hydrogenobacter sp. T-2]|uniref:tryptophan synthase subunit alpha n=1 Tax=Pampinifervens diazotrophicum TaxID=1632018 RepID=UPI002B258116|nr:tryptophan synthase subunit alpha [Hydrogenobacter sp. T-2]WPM32461.1 tryptophan synthase subunit alpha [Hydrogenobacter sp. T-2]